MTEAQLWCLGRKITDHERWGQATVEQRKPGLNGWWQTSLYYADSGHRRPSSLKAAYPGMRGSVWVDLPFPSFSWEQHEKKQKQKPKPTNP
ncbi:hypothetical protein J6590_093555 [Homalodisca vitripennis]|nr:hypothetical protein J6590_093555 [Homalodisca vitripennis]